MFKKIFHNSWYCPIKALFPSAFIIHYLVFNFSIAWHKVVLLDGSLRKAVPTKSYDCCVFNYFTKFSTEGSFNISNAVETVVEVIDKKNKFDPYNKSKIGQSRQIVYTIGTWYMFLLYKHLLIKILLPNTRTCCIS